MKVIYTVKLMRRDLTCSHMCRTQLRIINNSSTTDRPNFRNSECQGHLRMIQQNFDDQVKVSDSTFPSKIIV